MMDLEGCSGTEDSDTDLLKMADIIETEKEQIVRESNSRYLTISSNLDSLIHSFKLQWILLWISF